MDLLEQSAAERNLQEFARIKDARRRTAEQKAEGFDIFLIPFHVFDPNRFLDRTQKYVRWIWRPPTVAISLVLIAMMTGVIVSHFDAHLGADPRALRVPAQALLGRGPVLLHSLLHRPDPRARARLRRASFTAARCTTSASRCSTSCRPSTATRPTPFSSRSKWHRLWVMLAGMYIEAIICCFAVALWVVSYPDTLLHELSYKLMLFTGISTLFFNINPLRSRSTATTPLRASSRSRSCARIRSSTSPPSSRSTSCGSTSRSPCSRAASAGSSSIYGPLALGFVVVIMLFIGAPLLQLLCEVLSQRRRRPARPDPAPPVSQAASARFCRASASSTSTRRSCSCRDAPVSPSCPSQPPSSCSSRCPGRRGRFETTAILAPWTSVRLEAPEDGIVVSVKAGEGDPVRAGEAVALMASPAVASRNRGRDGRAGRPPEAGQPPAPGRRRLRRVPRRAARGCLGARPRTGRGPPPPALGGQPDRRPPPDAPRPGPPGTFPQDRRSDRRSRRGRTGSRPRSPSASGSFPIFGSARPCPCSCRRGRPRSCTERSCASARPRRPSPDRPTARRPRCGRRSRRSDSSRWCSSTTPTGETCPG